jgi:hypothetical protein
MKPKGFALKKIVLQVLVLAVVAGAGVGFAGPGGSSDPDGGFFNPLLFPMLRLD